MKNMLNVMRRFTVLVLVVLLACVCTGASAEEGFLKIEAFSEGLAAVQNSEGLWGYIDKTGEVVIPCEWESAGAFSNGIASVQKNYRYGCIDRSGNSVIPCEWRGIPISFSEGLAPVKNDEGLWGFIDTTGTVMIPCVWEGPFPPSFSEGLAAVVKDGRMGYINHAGEVVIPCQYIYAEPFSHGYALVQDEEGLIFINTAGAVAFPEIPHANGGMSYQEDGIAHLEFDDYTGIFIDTEGRVVCSLSDQYRYRSNFHEGLAGIAKQNENGEWEGCEGYIDRTGAVAVPLELYSSFYHFVNGRACIPAAPNASGERYYGIIDQTGNLIYPYTLEKITKFEGNIAVAVQGGRTGVIDINGNVVVPFEFDDIRIGDGVLLCLKDGKIILLD